MSRIGCPTTGTDTCCERPKSVESAMCQFSSATCPDSAYSSALTCATKRTTTSTEIRPSRGIRGPGDPDLKSVECLSDEEPLTKVSRNVIYHEKRFIVIESVEPRKPKNLTDAPGRVYEIEIEPETESEPPSEDEDDFNQFETKADITPEPIKQPEPTKIWRSPFASIARLTRMNKNVFGEPSTTTTPTTTLTTTAPSRTTTSKISQPTTNTEGNSNNDILISTTNKATTSSITSPVDTSIPSKTPTSSNTRTNMFALAGLFRSKMTTVKAKDEIPSSADKKTDSQVNSLSDESTNPLGVTDDDSSPKTDKGINTRSKQVESNSTTTVVSDRNTNTGPTSTARKKNTLAFAKAVSTLAERNETSEQPSNSLSNEETRATSTKGPESSTSTQASSDIPPPPTETVTPSRKPFNFMLDFVSWFNKAKSDTDEPSNEDNASKPGLTKAGITDSKEPSDIPVRLTFSANTESNPDKSDSSNPDNPNASNPDKTDVSNPDDPDASNPDNPDAPNIETLKQDEVEDKTQSPTILPNQFNFPGKRKLFDVLSFFKKNDEAKTEPTNTNDATDESRVADPINTENNYKPVQASNELTSNDVNVTPDSLLSDGVPAITGGEETPKIQPVEPNVNEEENNLKDIKQTAVLTFRKNTTDTETCDQDKKTYERESDSPNVIWPSDHSFTETIYGEGDSGKDERLVHSCEAPFILPVKVDRRDSNSSSGCSSCSFSLTGIGLDEVKKKEKSSYKDSKLFFRFESRDENKSRSFSDDLGDISDTHDIFGGDKKGEEKSLEQGSIGKVFFAKNEKPIRPNLVEIKKHWKQDERKKVNAFDVIYLVSNENNPKDDSDSCSTTSVESLRTDLKPRKTNFSQRSSNHNNISYNCSIKETGLSNNNNIYNNYDYDGDNSNSICDYKDFNECKINISSRYEEPKNRPIGEKARDIVEEDIVKRDWNIEGEVREEEGEEREKEGKREIEEELIDKREEEEEERREERRENKEEKEELEKEEKEKGKKERRKETREEKEEKTEVEIELEKERDCRQMVKERGKEKREKERELKQARKEREKKKEKNLKQARKEREIEERKYEGASRSNSGSGTTTSSSNSLSSSSGSWRRCGLTPSRASSSERIVPGSEQLASSSRAGALASSASPQSASRVAMDTRDIEIVVDHEIEPSPRYGGGGGGNAGSGATDSNVGGLNSRSGGAGGANGGANRYHHRGSTAGGPATIHGAGGSHPSATHALSTHPHTAPGVSTITTGSSSSNHSSIHPGPHPSHGRKDRPGSRRGVAAIHGADPSPDSGDENSLQKTALWKQISRMLLDDRIGEVEDREKVLNPEQPGEYRILKKVLNILFVTIGIALLLAVIVVVIYTAIV